MMKSCPGYVSDGSAGQPYSQPRHAVENTPDNFSPGKSQCRDCYRAYAADWRAKRNVGGATTTRRSTSRAPKQVIVMPDFRAPAMSGKTIEGDEEFVSDEDMASPSHEFVPQPDLIETWGAVTNAAANGSHPFNMFFVGPSGSGKTESAEYLAAMVGLPFTKVDAPSMTDPESWFGTREVVAENGVSVTTYRPSAFVLAIEQPGVLLIDEANRIRDEHRNILLPLMDGTHQVTNPLTGDIVKKHPRCFIIMTGNVGLQFTGTYAVDPALKTRSLNLKFDYAPPEAELKIAQEATGCSEEVAALFVRFATETRAKAKQNPDDFLPISTREIISACRLVKNGASLDTAANVVVLNAASDEGGPQSTRMQLEAIWAGIRANPSASATAKKVQCEATSPYDSTIRCEEMFEVDAKTGKPIVGNAHGDGAHHSSHGPYGPQTW